MKKHRRWVEHKEAPQQSDETYCRSVPDFELSAFVLVIIENLNPQHVTYTFHSLVYPRDRLIKLIVKEMFTNENKFCIMSCHNFTCFSLICTLPHFLGNQSELYIRKLITSYVSKGIRINGLVHSSIYTVINMVYWCNVCFLVKRIQENACIILYMHYNSVIKIVQVPKSTTCNRNVSSMNQKLIRLNICT